MGATADGFIYPDNSGGVSLWTHIQNLATSIQTKRDAERLWNSWTPTWNTPTDGGVLSVGAGVNQGFYRMDGNKLVHAEFRVELGAGFSIQAGTFILNLPVPAYVWGGAAINGALGSWTARDNSTSGPVVHPSGTIGNWDTGGLRVHFAGAPAASFTGAPRRVDSNDPIPWASGDVLAGVLDYRAA
jgi:hypothetical protein